MAGMEWFFVSLFKVILINIVLSGDNAVVIAMACRNLEPAHQRKAYLWGSLGAILLVILLTFMALWMLKIPFLQVIGGLLLVWIAVKLLKGEDDVEIKGHSSLMDAIKTIIIADIVMSLDNSVAVAATAEGNLILIIIGLAVSIPLIIFGASLLTKLINRFPIIIYAGAGLLGYTAGEMIMKDPIVGDFLAYYYPPLQWLIPVSMIVLVLILGKLKATQREYAK